MNLPDCSLLLTGGTGFMGRALLRHWQSHPSDRPRCAVAISRNPKGFAESFPDLAQSKWLDLRYGDITYPDSLPRSGFDHVIHAATDSTAGPRLSPLERYTQIVDGTRNVLNAAVTAGATRFLLLSSGAIYGSRSDSQPDPNEDDFGAPDPLNPENAYGIGKRTAEHLATLTQQDHGLEVVIARCFAFVGRDLPLDAHFAIGNFIRDALWRDQITVAGDGSPIRSYMDQRDLCRWLVALLCQGKAGQAYNVGSEEALTVAELAHLVRDTLTPKKPVRIASTQGKELRSRYVPSTLKARNGLGIDLVYKLIDSIHETARYAGKQKENTHT
jgi:UDP-glucuronate decarboxylase